MKYLLLVLNSGMLILNSYLLGRGTLPWLLASVVGILASLAGIYFTCVIWRQDGEQRACEDMLRRTGKDD